MRSEVIDAVRALADREYQRRVWVGREYPNPDYYDDFTLNINVLYDDTRVLEDPVSAIGSFLRTDEEATVMRKLAAALNAILEEKGTDLTDEEYIADAGWDAVVKPDEHEGDDNEEANRR